MQYLDIELEEGYRYEIENDECPISPRDPAMGDQWCKLVTFHGRYDLSDKHNYVKDNYDSWDELQDAIKKFERPLAILPVYLYEHGGIRISTVPFGCEWDSGQIGFVYCKRDDVRKYGPRVKTTVNGKAEKKLEEHLRNEIDLYDLYISGQTYMIKVFKEDFDGEEELVEAIGGFLGGDFENNGILDYLEPYKVKVKEEV